MSKGGLRRLRVKSITRHPIHILHIRAESGNHQQYVTGLVQTFVGAAQGIAPNKKYD